MAEGSQNNTSKKKCASNEGGQSIEEKEEIEYIRDNTKFLSNCPPLTDEGFTNPSFYVHALMNTTDKASIVKCWTYDSHIVNPKQPAQAAKHKGPPQSPQATKVPKVEQIPSDKDQGMDEVSEL